MRNKEDKIYLTQKAILFDKDGRILTLRRTETAPSHPLHWDLPGGEAEYGNGLEDEIRREIREETGLEIADVEVIDALGKFDDKGEYWVTICYEAGPVSGDVILSYEHDDYEWIDPEKFLELKISSRIRRFIERFMKKSRNKCLKHYYHEQDSRG